MVSASRILLLAVGLAVIAVVGFYFWASAEFTECYGSFESREAAERAADRAEDAGLGTDVDHRRSESAVTFDTEETGDDAREARQAFREIIKVENGRLGHPGNGCLERAAFE